MLCHVLPREKEKERNTKETLCANLDNVCNVVKMPADLAVWAATDEAEFLHGRWFDGHWDVEEMKAREFKDRLEADKNFLRLGLCGVERVTPA